MPLQHEVRVLNERQKGYYEARFNAYSGGSHDLENASRFTNLWWRMRDRILAVDQEIGARAAVAELHEQWLGDLSERTVLDLGCFCGNQFSLLLAGRAATYRGVDLSERAVSELNRKLAGLERPDAVAMAVDVLDNPFAEQSFDVVYAKSVLHHFSDLASLCQELDRLLRPGGIIISDDPLQTEPFNRLARLIYRPFQTDRDWEWPFTRRSIRILQDHFAIVDIQGVWGVSKLALPVALLPFGRGVSTRLGRWGLKVDQARARRPGPFLYNCWNVTMLLRKRQPVQRRST